MRADRSSLLRGLAGLLAVFAATPILLLPYTLPTIFRFTVELLVIGLVLRASLGWFRHVWWFAIVAFALITAGAVSNEFHGRPPVALHLIIGWWSVSLALAIVGLYFEKSRNSPAVGSYLLLRRLATLWTTPD